MDLKEELDSTVAMKLDKDNLAKILSLWLHVEALTILSNRCRGA